MKEDKKLSLKNYWESNTSQERVYQWISVKDKLPDTPDEVWIADETYENYYGKGSYTANGWSIAGSNYWTPTHWMKIKPLKPQS